MTTPRKGALPAITLRSDDFDALDRLEAAVAAVTARSTAQAGQGA